MADSVFSQYKPPATALQAVNLVLSALGQVPIASLDSASTNVSAESSINRIGESLRETLEEGWHVNTVTITIDPTSEGKIALPANTLKAIQAYFPGGWNMDLVQRGAFMFDAAKNSYNIGQAVTLTLIQSLDFEELPAAHRWYVAIKAARRAVAGALVSGTAYQFTQADENTARLRMEQADAETSRRNMYDNPHIRRMRRK